MKYEDKVYGNFEITEPVILELLDSPTLLRLKDVDQAGYLEPYFPGTAYSRFEHSVGDYLLLRMYKAPIEEQIAGLIHDVSHSAFSHCVDYVLKDGSGKEYDHQDNIFDEYVRKSEIPEILNKYDIDLDYILNDKNFPLKENDLPDLCSDRIDYSLRTAIAFKEIENGNFFIDNLTTNNGKWVFKDFESAKKYAGLFLKLNINYYTGIQSAVMFLTVGDYLRYALSKGYVSESDLYLTDKIVLSKIQQYISKDQKLKLLFERMNNKIGYKNDPDNYDGKVFFKSRVVDPLCWNNGEIKRVSLIEPGWVEIIQRESNPKKYFIKFES